MTKVTWKDTAKKITIEDVEKYFLPLGISVAVNDGKDITLEIEKEPTASQAK